MFGFTGATGALGRHIAEAVAATGLPHRAIARDATKIPEAPGRTRLAADYDDVPSLRRAFEGLERLFLMSTSDAPAPRRQRHRNAIRAAREAGVPHILFLSLRDSVPSSPFPFAVANHDAELALREGGEGPGADWTLLHPNLYAEAIVGMGAESLRSQRLLPFPWGEGRVGFVTRADIAAVVTGLLTRGGARGQVLDITGPESLSPTEVCERLSAVMGAPVRYAPVPLEVYRRGLEQVFPPDTAAAFAGLCTALAQGRFNVVSDTVARYGGRAPTPLAAVLESQRALLSPTFKG
jgi:uncharacterized protein YbjT (DUF2867 family)